MTTTPRVKKQQLVKSSQAFRTISEVASILDMPQHVLRFWETKFEEVKPLKRGGGRRYYQPDLNRPCPAGALRRCETFQQQQLQGAGPVCD